MDAHSLERVYGPTVQRFLRDNRFAERVFLLHRLVFGSSVFSRVLYQAVVTERESLFAPQRRLETILWRIASGDDRYEDIFHAMTHPATLGSILTGGFLLTLRNYLAEVFFGLNWEGFGRFTTGVARERLGAKWTFLAGLTAECGIPMPREREFERMNTIKIQAPRARILEQLGQFGEAHRRHFKPRWMRIHRVHGVPSEVGCAIRYDIGGAFSFSLVLEQLVGEHPAVYRVRDGFARGGVLIVEIERCSDQLSALSIYVAFNFPRGMHWATGPLWWACRQLFPAFMRDGLWNHSLCQLKDLVEAEAACPPPHS